MKGRKVSEAENMTQNRRPQQGGEPDPHKEDRVDTDKSGGFKRHAEKYIMNYTRITRRAHII